MLKRLLLKAIAATVIALTLAACGAGEETTPAPGISSPPPPPPTLEQTPDTGVSPPTEAPAPTGQGTLFAIVNEDPGGSGTYKFNPSELTFAVGETVDFTLTAETELHNFTVEELSIDKDVDSGQQVTFSHTFEKAGTYRLICIFHEANGMVGMITVK